jgi:hypothetical protein
MAKSKGFSIDLLKEDYDTSKNGIFHTKAFQTRLLQHAIVHDNLGPASHTKQC